MLIENMHAVDENGVYQIIACQYCSKWYKNNHGGEQCVWNNREVPKACDFCSRFSPIGKDEVNTNE